MTANPRKFLFTVAALRGIPTPAKGRVYYYDTRESALELAVTSNSRTFYAYKWSSELGKPLRSRLGTVSDLSLEQARKLAAEKKLEIVTGGNPTARKRAVREEITLGEQYIWSEEFRFKPHNRAWEEQRKTFDRVFDHWRNRPLSSIGSDQVHALHARIARERGRYAANRAVALLSVLFSAALKRGWKGLNPCISIEKFPEQSRERFLQAHELPKFLNAVREEKNEGIRDFFLLALFTGARKANLLAMRWNDLDLEAETWRIPMTKSGKAQSVPLVTQAIEILRAREGNRTSGFVFPATARDGHLTDPKKAWARVLKASGISDLHIHDLRRSLGSWQLATGAHLSVIGKTLGHSSSRVTEVYARFDLSSVRDAMGRATDAMLAVKPEASNGEDIVH